MNRFDAYITDYLYENKEVALENIGIIRITAHSNQDAQAAAVDFIFNKKITTTQNLISFIAEKSGKSKNLIASDLESHFTQAREFINIGKNYEIPQIGFIKANNKGVYEFVPYSAMNKPVTTGRQTVKQRKRTNKISILQLFTFLIVIAILSGLGWEAYQFYKERNNDNSGNTVSNTDTISNTMVQGKTNLDSSNIHPQQPITYSPDDTANIQYIFETTASGLRARTRTEQLKNLGSNAAYDSFIHNNTMFYHLFITISTKIADTTTVKDSLSKFLMRDITLKIDSTK